MNNIVKIAGPVSKPKKPASGPTSKPKKPISGSTSKQNAVGLNTGGGSIPEVKEMQSAMQLLARKIIHDTKQEHAFRTPADAVKQKAEDHTLEGKSSFNDFMAENFIGELPKNLKGVEWNKHEAVNEYKDPAGQKNKPKGATDIYEMDVVLDTMKRIGVANSEFKADGNWGWRTNNALKNMFGYSYALLQLEGELGLTNNIYTASDLRTFYNSLPTSAQVKDTKILLSNEEKKNRAKIITELLEKITNLYTKFRTDVLTDPNKRGFIDNDRAFAQFTPQGSNPDSLNDTDNNLLKTNMEFKLPVKYIARAKVQNKDTWDNVKNPKLDAWGQLDYIPINALTSKEEYLKWMMGPSVGVPSEYMAISIFNKTIKPQIDKLVYENNILKDRK